MSSVVFRRLGTAERPRARGMLDAGGCVYRSPRLDGGVVWYGLYDLTAGNGAAAAAAAVWLSTRVLEVRAMVVPGGVAPLRARLVRELTDAGRARGAQWLVAADAGDLLRREGFAPVAAADLGLVERDPVTWFAVEI